MGDERRLARGSGDPLVEGRESLTRLADVYAAHGPLLRAIAEAASHDAAVEGVYRNLVQGFVDATAARIRRDAAAGPAWPTPTRSPRPWSG